MPSPFPGMDPYLENSDFWAEFHNRLIVAIADCLTPQIRPKYEVAIEKRIYEINEPNGDSLLVGIPDVAIKRQSSPNIALTKVAIAAPTTPLTVRVPIPEQIKQAYLEVRDLARGRVVTAIEIISPVNKRSGEGREFYLQKRQRILGSLTNLVEIDLLRRWQPLPILATNIQSYYRLLVSCAYRRPMAELYAFNLREPLPTFTLPLSSKEEEPKLNLQELLTEVYNRAGYDYRIDYNRDLVPSLPDSDAAWVKKILSEKELKQRS